MKRILGIDWGERKLGLSIGDTELYIAVPYKVIRYNNRDTAIKEIKEICLKENIDEVIVGVPITEEGKLGYMAKRVLDFVEHLKRENIEVKTYDERLTTSQIYSEKRYHQLKHKTKKKRRVKDEDSLSATIILQAYLDSIKSTLK